MRRKGFGYLTTSDKSQIICLALMSKLPQGHIATRSIRIPAETWKSVSHESVDRRCSVSYLLTVAWTQFMAQPESRRDRLVRESQVAGTA